MLISLMTIILISLIILTSKPNESAEKVRELTLLLIGVENAGKSSVASNLKVRELY